jgi:hypothetical protein
MSTLSVNNILPISGNSVVVSGSLTVTGNITGNVSGSITNATTASYVAAANVDGTVANAATASYVTALNQNVTISGSILVSGSLIPNTDGISSTSSFNLGSPTAAWKDIYVSNGTINFLDNTGTIVQTIGTGNNQLTGYTIISGSLAQGFRITASGIFSHAEGYKTTASGDYSHAEGQNAAAKADASHAEGYFSTAGLPAWDTNSTVNGTTQLPSFIGNITSSFTPSTVVALGANYLIVSRSFFQSNLTQVQYVSASNLNLGGGTALAIIDIYNPLTIYPNQTLRAGYAGHAEGTGNTALFGHAEGNNSVAFGSYSHAEGVGTIAVADGQHTSGKFNAISTNPEDLFIIGNGVDNNNRKNILTVSTSSVVVSGSILVSGSLIPNTDGISSTSSFSLGSPTNAWKDIYVSNGTINFLDGAGNVQGTLGTGTNATVITGSLQVVPINPLTGFTTTNGTLLHKSYTTADCAFALADSSNFYSPNPQIYSYGGLMVLPWDKKITAYSLYNNILSNPLAILTSNPLVCLPPIQNAGYSVGETITVYNMGETTPSYKNTGSIFITTAMMGVTAVNQGNKTITATFNTSYIFSGSWGNYTALSSFISATTESIKINPGQKATFEVVYWGSNQAPSPTSASLNGFYENGYQTNFTNINPWVSK